jgi:hypothetical protein
MIAHVVQLPPFLLTSIAISQRFPLSRRAALGEPVTIVNIISV